MPKIIIDGKEIDAREGEYIITAALREGIEIPHLCYHPRLVRAGNCRMCLVEIEGMKKLEISCGMPVWDGMVVFTDSERVKRAREAVLEFLLIHHPLDCPVCDQCGECKLQDYCVRHGKVGSRFTEQKITHPPISLGKTITIHQNRCIKCTRCIRFFRDLTGDEPLSISERGGLSVVGPYIDTEITNPFSVNAVDLCPTGALTETHFRFKARTWLMSRTATLCPGCARGCNVIAWTHKGEIKRLTPRLNEAVNLEWMCDAGRVSFDRMAGPDRLSHAWIQGKVSDIRTATALAVEKIRSTERSKIGVIGSSVLTNEDNFAVRALAEKIGTDKIYLIQGNKEDRPFGPVNASLPEWFIREDKSPNARGAVDMLGNPAGLDQLMEDINAARIAGLLVFSADPVASAEGAAAVFKKLDWMIVQDTHRTKTAEAAHAVLPEASAFEKQGTFTNEGGRVQKIAAIILPTGESRSALQTACAIGEMLGGADLFTSAAEGFDAIAETVPAYKNLSWTKIGQEGALLQEDITPVKEK